MNSGTMETENHEPLRLSLSADAPERTVAELENIFQVSAAGNGGWKHGR